MQNRDLKRLFLSAFYHEDESHLVYNIFSLFSKGVQLETMMGSTKFASMVAVLLGLSHGIVVVLAKVLATFFDDPYPWTSECTIGFSSVLFALNVVLNSNSGSTSVYGVLLPQQYAAWAELILIQMFVPGVSFLGHLGGILAGILYLRLKGGYSGSDPLTVLFKGLAGALSWPVKLIRKFFGSQQRRISGRGTVGRNRADTGRTPSDVWRCQECTFDNSGWLSVCEMCGTNRSGNGNGFSSRQSLHHSRDPSLEEVRRRRIDRFGR